MAGDVEGVGLCNSPLLAFTSTGSRGRARYRHRLVLPPLCPSVTGLKRSLGAGRRREVVHVSRAGGRRMRWGMSPGAPKFGLHAAPRRRRARTLGKRTLDSRNFAAVPSSRFGAPRRWRGRGASRGHRAWSSFQERVRHRARPGRAFSCPLSLLCASSALNEGPR